MQGDLADTRDSFLEIGIFLCYVSKGLVEHRNLMPHPESDVCIVVKSLVLSFIDVGYLQGDCFVPAGARHLDAAVPVLVLDIGPAEDDEAALEFLNVGEEMVHGWLSVYVPCIKNLQPFDSAYAVNGLYTGMIARLLLNIS